MTSKKGSLVTALGNGVVEPETNEAPQADTKETVAPQPQPQPTAHTAIAKRNRSQEALLAEQQRRENDRVYAEAGFLYAAPSPVANSIGGEAGFVTKDEKTGEVYRSGAGFYLRSDHLCKLPAIDMSKIDL